MELKDLIADPPVLPTSYNILVYVPPFEQKSTGGIIMATDTEAERERMGSSEGYVVAVGPQAWKELGDGTPWAEVGDKIIFDRYAGKALDQMGLDKGRYRIMRDEEPLGLCQK